MTEEIKKLIKKDGYQVFVLSSPGNLPFFFATHNWFVINKFGELSRWEVRFEKDHNNPLGKHLYKDFFPPFQGIGLLPYLYKPNWKSRLIHVCEGDNNSSTKKMIDFIEASPINYKYKDYYSLSGPNSNTYVQWVLNHFKELPVQLPWTAIGKGYNKFS